MSIVLNEYEWAENMINSCSIGKRPVETLTRVSKYYHENNYSKKEIREILDSFMLRCDPQVSLSRWSGTLDRIAKSAGKYPLIRLDGVPITKAELDRIGTLKGKQLRRLAFTLLCVSKYWDFVSESNNHWVNTQDKEVMQMANINTTIKRQSAMFAELKEAGMIRFSKKIDNLNVQVLFSGEGEPVLNISDFRNLGYQYQKYCGEPYFECANCGITVKMKEPARGRRQKYCPECAAQLHTKQNVDSVMRRRSLITS